MRCLVGTGVSLGITTMTVLVVSFLLFLLVVGSVVVVEGKVSGNVIAPRHCGGMIRHVHLAVGPDSSTSMMVSFATLLSHYIHQPDQLDTLPIGGVLIGTSPDQLTTMFMEQENDLNHKNNNKNNKSDASSSTRPSRVLFGHAYNLTTKRTQWSNDSNNKSSTVYWSPYYHHVLVTGLEPATTYHYQLVVATNRQEFHNKYGLYLLRQKSSRSSHQSRTHQTNNNNKIPPSQPTNNNNMNKTNYQQQQPYWIRLRSSKQQQPPTTTTTAKPLLVQQDGFLVRHHLRGLGQEHRQLVRWGPYHGLEETCPSPDKIRTFCTAPAPALSSSSSKTSTTTTFAIMGDLGQFPHSQKTMARLIQSKKQINAAILAGDIAYTGTDHRKWDTFFDFLDDYMAFETIPLQICPGNHDIDKYETSNEIFLAYEYRFRMPQVEPAQLGVYDGPLGKLNMDQPPYPLPYEYGNSYYSWKYGGVHFIMVNAYASMEQGSKQQRFIKKELQSVKRDITPWVIVVIHTPIYNTFGLHRADPQIVAAKENLEPLFVQYKVNLIFAGHIHAYSRTYAVAMDQLNDTGPIHITVGAGGRKCEAPFAERIPEKWIAIRDATMYGFGMLRIHNATTAEWDWIQTSPTDDDRHYNQLKGFPEEKLAAGPSNDHVYLTNQYYL